MFMKRNVNIVVNVLILQTMDVGIMGFFNLD